MTVRRSLHDRSPRHSYRRLGHLFFLARDWILRIRELQHTVLHLPVSQAHNVQRVVLIELPGWARALFGKRAIARCT